MLHGTASMTLVCMNAQVATCSLTGQAVLSILAGFPLDGSTVCDVVVRLTVSAENYRLAAAAWAGGAVLACAAGTPRVVTVIVRERMPLITPGERRVVFSATERLPEFTVEEAHVGLTVEEAPVTITVSLP